MKILKKISQVAIMGVLVPVLCSCAVHSSNFDSSNFDRCKNATGQRCTSVSKVNKMVDRGLILDEEEQKPAPKTVYKTRKRSKQKKKQKELEVWMPSTNNTTEKYI